MNGTTEEEGNDKAVGHTAESLEFTAVQLERVIADLRAGIGIMGAAKINGLDIPRESSRKAALKRLKSWADAVRDAIDVAAESAYQHPVSDSPAADEKRSKKK
jgi:uncharacterized protein YbjQ (UPF0145 family)